jgi:hypothetical protein
MVDLRENINLSDVYLIVEPLGWCDFNLVFFIGIRELLIGPKRRLSC